MGRGRPVPEFIVGDALSILQSLSDESVDCCITSPPYWAKRSYAHGGIGLEGDYRVYINSLLAILDEVKRVLKRSGSLWLNIGDSYQSKNLLGIPWRLAVRMTDERGWILRNEVIWNKVKGGPDNSIDKLGNVHEQVFHFVKDKRYYYNADAIRAYPGKSRVVNGVVISASGVTGVKYKRQIELSTSLTPPEKHQAFADLESILNQMRLGLLADFRMIIRGGQRATHSDCELVSGRAKELAARGYYFLKYHKNGSKPRDVWDILPEDTQGRDGHYAAYPEDLCRIPILATCPPTGIVLDPFVGTGTTTLVASKLGRQSVGIDISPHYINIAQRRCAIKTLL